MFLAVICKQYVFFPACIEYFNFKNVYKFCRDPYFFLFISILYFYIPKNYSETIAARGVPDGFSMLVLPCIPFTLKSFLMDLGCFHKERT